MSIRIRDYPTNLKHIRCLQSTQEVQITVLRIQSLVVRKTVTEVTGYHLAPSSILKDGFSFLRNASKHLLNYTLSR
jgi:hypothetical protein